METAKTQGRAPSRRVWKDQTERQMLRLFSAVVPELAETADGDELSTEERSEFVYGLNVIHKINSGRRGPGWPTVQLVDFLHKEIPGYYDQVSMLRQLRIETTGHFFKLSLDVIETAFEHRGVRFPKVLRMLHMVFNREKVCAKV